MKPFGIRLAFGAITILLGAIMAGQAQKNRQSETDSSWTIPPAESSSPPAPIAGIDNESWLSNPNTGPVGEGSPFPQSDSAVQLVQHLMPVDNGEQLGGGSVETEGIAAPKLEAPTFEIPEMQLPTLEEPADSTPVNAAVTTGPALSIMQLPGDGQETTPGADPALGTLAAPDFSMQLPGDTGAKQNEDSGALQSDAATGIMDGNVVIKDAGQNLGASALVVDENQPGNVLRGGGGVDLRSTPFERTQAMPQGQSTTPSEPIATGPASMLRTLAVPNPLTEQLQYGHGNAAPSGNMNPSGNLVADPGLYPGQNRVPATNPLVAAPIGGSAAGPYGQHNSAPTMRIVGEQQPRGVLPNSNSRLHMGPAQVSGAGINPVDPRYHRDAAYDRIGYGQPTAPPLPPGQPAARIAGLPEAPMRSSGYGPGLVAQPASARLNVDSSATMASPGDRRFEGVQSPSIVIQKRAPNEVKVGKPASFVIHVQNVGAVEALDVRVHDRVPAGMRLVDASPTPVQQGDVLVWQLGEMRAGDERTVTMQLIPMEEGELGSVARVTFEAAASVRTISTRPELKIVQNAPEKVLIGQQLEIELEVSNPGTGAAEGVVLQEDVPAGLEHPKGRQLDNALGTLQPGEVRRQVLRLRAVTPGVVQNTIRLKGEDGLEAIHTVAVEVVSPQVQIALTGPSRRFLERQATFQLDIGNSGTADATNVEIAAYLDRGFTFVSTDFEGQYDPSRHAVFWSLASLPVGEQGKVPLTLLPVKEGERAIRLEAKADLGITAKYEQTVRVDSLAELTFQINDSADPIEIGGETTYEIRLTNSGSRNDSNVRVQMQFPQGVELLSSDADAETNGRGLIAFAPRRELAAGGDLTFRVKARGVAPGTHIIKAVVISDQSQVPVTKEESTMVYSDR